MKEEKNMLFYQEEYILVKNINDENVSSLYLSYVNSSTIDEKCGMLHQIQKKCL
jgi:hypothetical protein